MIWANAIPGEASPYHFWSSTMFDNSGNIARIKFLINGPLFVSPTIRTNTIDFCFIAPNHWLAVQFQWDLAKSTRRFLWIYLKSGFLCAALPCNPASTKRRAIVRLDIVTCNNSLISRWTPVDVIFGSALEIRLIIKSVCTNVFLGLLLRGTLDTVSYLCTCCKALKTIFFGTLQMLRNLSIRSSRCTKLNNRASLLRSTTFVFSHSKF